MLRHSELSGRLIKNYKNIGGILTRILVRAFWKSRNIYANTYTEESSSIMSHKTVNLSKQVTNFKENGKDSHLYIFILATNNDVSCCGNGCQLDQRWAGPLVGWKTGTLCLWEVNHPVCVQTKAKERFYASYNLKGFCPWVEENTVDPDPIIFNKHNNMLTLSK